MSQVWFVGPSALHAGDATFKGDVGFELGFAFAFTAYCIARSIELRVFKRLLHVSYNSRSGLFTDRLILGQKATTLLPSPHPFPHPLQSSAATP
jgi:hypothetical protein